MVDRIGSACNYKLDKGRVFNNIHTVEQFRGIRGRRVGGEWAVDDMDRVLDALFGGPVDLVTSTATLIAPASTVEDDYVDGDVVQSWPEPARFDMHEARKALEG